MKKIFTKFSVCVESLCCDPEVVYDKKKKSEGKMVRAERQVVLDMLFSAFEKHQYYNFKELVDITKQPVVSVHTRTWTNTNTGAHTHTRTSLCLTI